ncbi:putative DNA-binding protein [Methanophagales archaeon]|nr:putative DNA-binding protein [Methanophagales archaeon]
MQKTIEVVYEKGVFKPLEQVDLKEGGKDKGRYKEVSREAFRDFSWKGFVEALRGNRR